MKFSTVSLPRLLTIICIIAQTGCQPSSNDSPAPGNEPITPHPPKEIESTGTTSPTSASVKTPEQTADERHTGPVFTNAVIERYFQQATGYTELKPSYLKNFSVLEFRQKELNSLKGVEFIQNLQKLDITQNQVADLRPLLGLNELTEIYASYNKIQDIEALANKTKLKNLHLGENPIQSLQPLQDHPSLEQASFIDTPIHDASPLTNSPTLKFLDLDYTNVNSLQGFEKLKNLEELRLNKTEISDITPLTNLTKLKSLHIQGTYVPQEQIAALKEANPDMEIYHDKETRLRGQPPATP